MINLTGKDLSGLARGVNMFKTVRRDKFVNSQDVASLEAIEQGVDEVEGKENASPSQKLFLSFNGKKYPVSSIKEAQDAWDKIRDAAIDQGIGNRAMDQDPLIVDSNGKRLHALSWNGSLMNAGPQIFYCPRCKEPTVAQHLGQSAECSNCSWYADKARDLKKVPDEVLREWRGDYKNGLSRGKDKYGK